MFSLGRGSMRKHLPKPITEKRIGREDGCRQITAESKPWNSHSRSSSQFCWGFHRLSKPLNANCYRHCLTKELCTKLRNFWACYWLYMSLEKRAFQVQTRIVKMGNEIQIWCHALGTTDVLPTSIVGRKEAICWIMYSGNWEMMSVSLISTFMVMILMLLSFRWRFLWQLILLVTLSTSPVLLPLIHNSSSIVIKIIK
jgi:hypothetical protein